MQVVDDLAAKYPNPDALDVPAKCHAKSPADSPAIPGQTSSIPDGVYRAQIPVALVTAAGDNNGGGWSGIWTLTIKDGTYTVRCRPLDQPGKDCGNVLLDVPVEAGNVRGTARTVWFVSDPDLLAAATGCTLPPSMGEGHCVKTPPYTAAWTASADGLTFRDSDNLSLVLAPWRRIA